jgi:arginyl-tRNA--protein-N-Asp/Glu arginylyltransferase
MRADESFQVYSKYQMKIHNDPPEKISMKSYERFLVKSPLEVIILLIDFFFLQFKTKLISVSSAESHNVNLTYNLYCKYQKIIHSDHENEFTDFISFLVTSPMKVS